MGGFLGCAGAALHNSHARPPRLTSLDCTRPNSVRPRDPQREKEYGEPLLLDAVEPAVPRSLPHTCDGASLNARARRGGQERPPCWKRKQLLLPASASTSRLANEDSPTTNPLAKSFKVRRSALEMPVRQLPAHGAAAEI